ncbi:MAG: hypothetical protein AAB505_00400, partial [Patescibacteria group bacterium]
METIHPNTRPEETFEDKRRAAQLAMEGPDWTAKREQATKEKQTSQEKIVLEEKLKELAGQKEVLELAWIKLDSQRKIIREAVTPIIERHNPAEEAEA